ncbi:MAG: DUF1631 family protein [Chromatiaceae bacterium]|nr:DUF1631 family protein [Chromatiaceae bacterium]
MAQTHGAPSMEAPDAPANTQALRLLLSASRDELPAILDTWVEHLLEELWRRNESADSDSLRMLFGNEIGLLVQARQSGYLARQMREALDELLTSPAPSSEPPSEQRGELELLDQDDFENWLVKSELNDRLEQELNDPLAKLRSQIDQLPGDPLRRLDPEHLIDLLEESLDQTGISRAALRICLRFAGHRIAPTLAGFYLGLSQRLQALGIRARERIQPPAPVRPPREAAALSPHRPQPAENLPPEAPPASVPQSAPPGSQLRELLNRLSTLAVQPPSSQAYSLHRAVQHWPRTLGHDQGDLLRLPRTHERVALTDQLIGTILTDSATPATLKTVLQRIPAHLLAMAVAHPGALLDERYPLVRLLDQIDQLARLLPNGVQDDAEHQREFEILIERLVAAEADDLAALDTLATQMSALKAQLQQLSRSNRAHWVAVCEIRERHRQAREQVRLRINAAFTARPTHPILIEVLNLGWRTLLEAVCLEDGLDSPRWRRHWRTLWQLHLDTGGGTPESSRPIESANHQVLLEALLDGLGATGLTPWECAELTGRVFQTLEQARLQQLDAALYRPFTPLAPGADDGPETAAPEDLDNATWRDALARVDALHLGTLLWIHEQERTRALRLIWRSEDGSRLGLADPLGKHLISLRRTRLARKLLREQASIDPTSPEGSVQRAATAALERMQSDIRHHEHPDPLTGLANQHQLRGALVELLAHPNHEQPLHLLGFLELDRFDLMTPHRGFARSEQILGAVAELLRAELPEARALAYLGGARFGALTAIAHAEAALALGERLRRALGALPFTPETQAGARGLSGSLGLSLLDREQATPEHHLSAASLACLTAQRNGGDRVMLFRAEDPLIREQLEQLHAWAQAEDAIRSERIRLRFQPIAPLADLDVLHPNGGHHSEILLSVYDEQHQPLHLGNFIAAAEALNLMRTLDQQVIETTLRWLNAHPHLDGPLGSVAINLSGQTIGDPDFVPWVGERLRHWAIAPERVGFEVTETAAIADLERAAANLEQLKALGCALYLDDFGSGLSSYGYLKRLPVDYVKIDGSFIKDIVHSPHDQAIVRSFNEIAHFMGKQTVAEFVENADIIELLRDIGVDHVQGYAIARPAFIDEVLARRGQDLRDAAPTE